MVASIPLLLVERVSARARTIQDGMKLAQVDQRFFLEKECASSRSITERICVHYYQMCRLGAEWATHG